MRYELQGRYEPHRGWEYVDGGQSLARLRLVKRRLKHEYPTNEYQIVELKPDAPVMPAPTIEERHAAELEKLAVDEKRWAAKAKRAATTLKKIRRRKRRLERMYAERDDA